MQNSIDDDHQDKFRVAKNTQNKNRHAKEITKPGRIGRGATYHISLSEKKRDVPTILPVVVTGTLGGRVLPKLRIIFCSTQPMSYALG